LVVLDTARGKYSGPLDQGLLESWGVGVVDTGLVSDGGEPFIDGGRLNEVLLSLT
jgi:hypothetical protein